MKEEIETLIQARIGWAHDEIRLACDDLKGYDINKLQRAAHKLTAVLELKEAVENLINEFYEKNQGSLEAQDLGPTS